MIKRTLYFGNPVYLSKQLDQLIINLPNAQGLDDLSGRNTVPIEDIGVVMLDHPQITTTQGLMSSLLTNNVAIIHCDNAHLPVGLVLPLVGHTTQTATFRAQITASEPLKKQLWQQIISAKIRNQAELLRRAGQPTEPIDRWAREVRSGDPDNLEARAAGYYWPRLFKHTITDFRREREGEPPNHLLNYGYAILRAIVARAVVGAGLLPTLGLHHHNQYNPYCLADDLMEPYRPFVDVLVGDMVALGNSAEPLTKSNKARFLGLPTIDVRLDGDRSPLQVAVQRTAASVTRCLTADSRKALLPDFV